ncbi:MAG TPA: hypothetical protein VEF04_17900 [Blastocatellia bacterium]|nr:hypothetical protein [Blastocatellia bacterium]
MVWKELLKELLKWLLGVIFAPLVAKGILSDELYTRLMTEGVQQILGVVIALLLLLWGMRQQIISTAKTVIAAQLPEQTSVKEVNEAAKELTFKEKVQVAVKQEL